MLMTLTDSSRTIFVMIFVQSVSFKTLHEFLPERLPERLPELSFVGVVFIGGGVLMRF